MSQISISELSQTISELIDLDADKQSLMTGEIDRAIDTRQIVGGSISPYQSSWSGSSSASEARSAQSSQAPAGNAASTPSADYTAALVSKMAASAFAAMSAAASRRRG
jgi:hypothetical protein